MRAALVLLAGAAVSLSAVPAHADDSPPVGRTEQGAVDSTPSQSNRVIVRWEAGTTRADRLEARAAAGVDDARGLGNRFQVFDLVAGQDPDAAVMALKADPAVADAERDRYYQVQGTAPNDPRFDALWGLDNQGLNVGGVLTSTPGADIDALKAWDKTVGDASVLVADLDDGIRPDHPDLKSRIWTNTDEVPGDGLDNDANGYADDTFGMDFVGASVVTPAPDNDPTDTVVNGGHGTHTAGTIAAAGNDGVGITGVAQKSTLMPVRVCGGPSCPTSSIIAGINYAGDNGAKIANMSLGGTGVSNLMRDALAAHPQTLYVIAAGNNNVDVQVTPFYPCAYDPSTSSVPGAIDNVVCVAASDQNDGKASFSNWGKTSVDLAAPGTEILSTYTYSDKVKDDFEAPGFPAGWSTDGWIRVATSPGGSAALTNDTATQTAGTSRVLTSPTVNVNGAGRCLVSSTERFTRSVADTLRWQVLVDGVPALDYTYSTPYVGSYTDGITISGAGPHSLVVRYTYNRQAGGDAGNGLWLDRFGISCWTPPGSESASDYAFLQGTSMATPHVTGAAALLAAFEPSATTLQLKQALLSSVDPVTAFATNGARPIATGGRLNADKALTAVDALIAPDTTLSSGPGGDGPSATFAFTSPAKTPVTFECQVDGGGYSACTSPFTVNGLTPGAHAFDVRAKDTPGNVDASPASANWAVAAAPPVLNAPGKVAGVKVKRKKSSAVIRWNAAPGATSYLLKFGKKTSTTTKTTFRVKKLKPGKKYRVTIVAINAGGQSPGTGVKVLKFSKR